MPLSDRLAHIDRLFQTAASAALANAPRRLATVTALATAATVHAQTAVHVDDDAPPGGDGTTWQTAFRDLQDALNRVNSRNQTNAVVKIAGGVYAAQASSYFSAFSLTTSGVTLAGGFAGVGQPDPDRHDPAAFATVLTGDATRDDGPGFTNRQNNNRIVLQMHDLDTAQLRDLVIRGARAPYGAAVARTPDGPCTIALVRCIIEDNIGSAFVGGNATAVVLVDSTIRLNLSSEGRSVLSAGDVIAYGCSILGNANVYDAVPSGSLVSVRTTAGVLMLEQCLLVGGQGVSGLGRPHRTLLPAAAAASVRSCTLVTATVDQAAFGAGGSIELRNSIVSSLSSASCKLVDERFSELQVSHSCLHIQNQDLQAQSVFAHVGNGLVFGNPRFRAPFGADGDPSTPLDNDFRLRDASPAIDLADAQFWPGDHDDADDDGVFAEPIPFDLSGALRLHDDPGTPNLGVGFSPALDAGPYEFQGVSCRADFDASGLVAVGDIFSLLAEYFAQSPDADFNRSGATDLGDIFDFLAAYFAGCP